MTARNFSAGTKDREDVRNVADHQIRNNEVDAPKSMPCDHWHPVRGVRIPKDFSGSIGGEDGKLVDAHWRRGRVIP